MNDALHDFGSHHTNYYPDNYLIHDEVQSTVAYLPPSQNRTARQKLGLFPCSHTYFFYRTACGGIRYVATGHPCWW